MCSFINSSISSSFYLLSSFLLSVIISSIKCLKLASLFSFSVLTIRNTVAWRDFKRIIPHIAERKNCFNLLFPDPQWRSSMKVILPMISVLCVSQLCLLHYCYHWISHNCAVYPAAAFLSFFFYYQMMIDDLRGSDGGSGKFLGLGQNAHRQLAATGSGIYLMLVSPLLIHTSSLDNYVLHSSHL